MLKLGGFKTWKLEQQVNVESLVTVEVGDSDHNTEEISDLTTAEDLADSILIALSAREKWKFEKEKKVSVVRVGRSVCVGTGLATPKQTYVHAPNIKGRYSIFKVKQDSIKTELDKMLLDKSIDENMLELGGFKTWKLEQQVNVETLVTVEVGDSNHNTEEISDITTAEDLADIVIISLSARKKWKIGLGQLIILVTMV